MNDLLEYSLISWYQFFLLAVVAVLLLIIADRFHLFSKQNWSTSIGYHAFFSVVLTIIVIAFLAIRPIFHLMFMLVVFGFIYKNVFAYVRSIFNLYFSKIQIGDRIKVNAIEGNLNSINLGGMHITSNDQKTFIPFNNWKGSKIVLLSENGKVPFMMRVKDDGSRTKQDALLTIEKKIFEFPYLANDPVDIKIDGELIEVKVELTGEEYRASMNDRITQAGFAKQNNKTE